MILNGKTTAWLLDGRNNMDNKNNTGKHNKEIESFKKFLHSHGAEVLQTTNAYELVRFKANGVVSVIYSGKKGTSFVGESESAWNHFKNIKKGWAVRSKGNRTKLSVKKRTLLERDGECCFFCKQPMIDDQISVEHLLSLVHGGNNHISNLVLCHKICNEKVGNMSIMDKIRYREKH